MAHLNTFPGLISSTDLHRGECESNLALMDSLVILASNCKGTINKVIQALRCVVESQHLKGIWKGFTGGK